MSDTLKKIKAVLPEPVKGVYRGTRDWIRRTAGYPNAMLHPWRRESIQRLQAMKDTHRGERCFILGNGPSLKDTDLTRLKGESTFGMNRIYLLFPELGFQTTFYVAINDLVVEQCAQDIQNLDLPRFVSWRARKWLHAAENLHFLYTTYTGPKFARTATGRLWEGGTVTYAALQLAYHFGFKQVILIGVDHNFVTKGPANQTVVSQGDDPNHFHPSYFGKGFRWQLPDLEASEHGYRLARAAYEADGREVLDATIGGKLQVFPKVRYDSLF
ncbi:MAG TPA: 6-hydroxymethylpterin diphosphokinase MptE-like protein [Anaerolineaceae bacterium]